MIKLFLYTSSTMDSVFVIATILYHNMVVWKAKDVGIQYTALHIMQPVDTFVNYVHTIKIT
jgi:hypothetical protein